MKRRIVIAVIAASMALGSLTGCSGTDNAAENSTEAASEVTTEADAEDSSTEADTEPALEPVDVSEIMKTDEAKKDPARKTNTTSIPEGMYASELTGTAVSEDIKNQRPIAVMVDNDERALPHFSVSDADIVYEMMNSTANNRITRLMCVYKDWQNIDQIGSIRSTRSTNPMLAAEYNAVLIHDGGPYYINSYLNQSWARHLSGSFTRISNGKAREFTEYVVAGEAAKRIKAAGYSVEYDSYKNDDDTHFNFGSVDLSSYGEPAKNADLPFPHNESELKYNEKTGTYDYYEYGKAHVDSGDTDPTTFTNVILQNVDFAQLDENGYLVYNVIGEGAGYYMTGEYRVPITWRKCSETDITRYYDANGDEITINAGKTYIGLIPSDSWGNLEVS